MIRIVVIAAALAGVVLIARVAWPTIAANLTAMESWPRTEGEVRAMNGLVEFELGREPDSYRVSTTVDHTWGLRMFKMAPLFVDPANPSRVKPAGFLQMWLLPAGLSVYILLLLSTAWMAVRVGTGQESAPTGGLQTQSQWMFTKPPAPLSGGITLHSPASRWKAPLLWSLLGVALVVTHLLMKGGNSLSRTGYLMLGTAFTLSLWALAWHTKSLEISANHQGIRMTSVLGWRDLPWGLVRGVEDQSIFTTYYNGQMRMWELPFPGSTVRLFAFQGERGRTLMSLSPELEPRDSLYRLFDLCTERTGLRMNQRTIAIHY